MTILPRKFYNRNTLKVAKELLGCFLVREYRGKIWRAMITETEAYHGEDDLASHASRGRTPRTKTMYGEPGRAYIYMIYGMYHCLNIVTEKKGFPAAVLIRGVKINPPPTPPLRKGERTGFPLWKRGTKGDLNGPGKLCRFLKIDKKLNRWDLTRGEKLWVEKPKPSGFAGSGGAGKIQESKRIGIDYAKHCKEYLWRFHI
jgi:DNA-3-methyladenine glycosylase